MAEHMHGWHGDMKALYARVQVLLGALLTLWVALGFEFERVFPFIIVLGLSTLVLAGVCWKSRLEPDRLASLALVFELLWSGILLMLLGPQPAPLLLMSGGVVAAGLLFGRRTTLQLVGISTVLFAVSATGLVATSGASELAPIPALIFTSTAFGGWSGLALLALETGERLDERFHERAPPMLLLSQERRARAELEASRDRAKAAFVQAQRKDAVTALAGGLAHDFNNTLMVIMSWVELIKDDDDPELLAEATREIDDAASQASSLARQLLKLGRPDSATPEPTDLPAELTRVVQSLRKLLPNNIELSVEVEPVPAVLAEPSQLQQIILNLAINARDAMPEGGKLRFGVWFESSANTTADELGAGDWVVLAVADGGTGMDEATQAKIFEPFFTTKASGRGSGLGLASVLALVNQLGGRLSLDSVLGEGSTFEIRLPARPELDALCSVDVEESEHEIEGRVLVVEHEPQIRAFLCKALMELGLEVHATADGDAAAKLIRELDQLDLLCTDAKVPGVEPARYIEQAQRRFPTCQVLVCSGYLPDAVMRREVAAGRYAYLAKPFNRQQLARQLHALSFMASHQG